MPDKQLPDGAWVDEDGRVHVPLGGPPRIEGPPVPILWVDLETTGLEITEKSAICEIAVVVTDAELQIIETWERILHVPGDASWEPVAEQMHRRSGLRSLCDHPAATEVAEAEEALMKMLGRRFEPDVRLRPGGSSVQFDRRWLEAKMPRVSGLLHPYRNVDVSTLKELAAIWAPGLREAWEQQLKGRPHRAMPDILTSLAELRFYRQHGFVDVPSSDAVDVASR